MEDIDRELPDLVALVERMPSQAFMQTLNPQSSYSLLNAEDLRICAMPELAATFKAGFCLHENWVWREARRFFTAEYSRSVSGGYDLGLLDLRNLPGHFLHLSKQDPRLVAYTPTPEHGRQDRQVRSTLGKYLSRYQTELGLTSSDIGRLTRLWGNVANVNFGLIRDADDIQYVYDHGPDSCMKELGNPAVQAYAGPDTALAVMWQGPKEGGVRGACNIAARCVVSLLNQQYVRIYSDCDAEDQLEDWLAGEGFERDSMALLGCRLRYQPGGSTIYAPYLDGDVRYGIVEDGYLRLSDSGLELRAAGGQVAIGEVCSDCGEHAEELTEVQGGDRVCASCLENYRLAYTEFCEEWVPEDDVVGRDDSGDAYTDDGAEHYSLVIPEDSDCLKPRDECICTEDDRYFASVYSARDQGYYETVSGEWLQEHDMAPKGFRKATDDEWVPENDLRAYGYVEIEDPDDEDETLIVPIADLGAYGLALRNGKVVPEGQLEIPFPDKPEATHGQCLAA